jgi:hypothetical protein
MKTSPSTLLRLLAGLLSALCVLAVSQVAFAAEDLLVVVAQEVTTGEGASPSVSFWWGSPTPQWTAFDVALREAMRTEGTPMAEPRSASELSKIYRVPGLNDSSALAMASVFGRRRVLVGTVKYMPTAMSPVGLAGWRAVVDIRLVERGDDGPSIRHKLSFTRAWWGASSGDAQAALRSDVAEQVARSVAGGLQRKVGPVGVNSEEVLIGLRSAGKRAVVDTIMGRLKTFAGVTNVGIRWAAEGQIVLEVNPGEVDPEASVRQYASLLSAQEFEDFRLTAGGANEPSVIVFRVEERM